MSIGYKLGPKEQITVEFKAPKVRTEWTFFGSYDKTEIVLYALTVIPSVETGVDAVNATTIALFLKNIECETEGGSVWKIVANYDSSPDTIDLAFNFGVASTKIYTAIADVKSYNCQSPASANTLADIGTAQAAASTASSDADDIAAAVANLDAAIIAAIIAANDPAVDPAVKALCLSCINHCNAAGAAVTLVAASVHNTADIIVNADPTISTVCSEANDGNITGVTTACASSASFSTDATSHAATALTESTAAQGDAAAATAAAGGGSAESIAAAAAAQNAADEASAAYTVANTAAVSGAAANAAAQTLIADVTADQAIGGNGVPNFQKAIGVSEDKVEGVEIEIGSVEFVITKKFSRAVLPAGYYKLLADFTDRSSVNHANFALTFLGQTLFFDKGSLRFRCVETKQTNDFELEISYHLAYSRSITEDDNFRIGNSAKITKEGWHYLWIRFEAFVSSGIPGGIPKFAVVCQVYPYKDFGGLQL